MKKLSPLANDHAAAVAQSADLIHKAIETAASAFVTIARELYKVDALISEHNAQCLHAKEKIRLTDWATGEFGFSKSWVHKALRFARTFELDALESTLDLLPAHVLSSLPGMRFELVRETQEIIREAQDQKAATDSAPEIQDIDESAAADILDIFQQHKEEKAKAKSVAPTDQEPPWSTPSTPSTPDLFPELERLTREVEERDVVICDLQTRLRTLESRTKKAPELVQLQSTEPHVVLGLTPDQAHGKRLINSAARMLSSLYRGCDDSGVALKKIKEAKDSLLASIS